VNLEADRKVVAQLLLAATLSLLSLYHYRDVIITATVEIRVKVQNIGSIPVLSLLIYMMQGMLIHPAPSPLSLPSSPPIHSGGPGFLWVFPVVDRSAVRVPLTILRR